MCLICLYFAIENHQLKKLVEQKEKIMGVRLIDGMKVLSDLLKNSFDTHRATKSKIDKLNAKTRDYDTRLRQINHNQHRVVGERNKSANEGEKRPINERTSWQKQTSGEKSKKVL